jgi:hypothetical protein
VTWLERLAIRMLERTITRELSSYSALPGNGSTLVLGKARSPYGTRGSTSVWLTDQDRRRHALFSGSSGSGKTVAALGYCIQDIIAGRPFTLIDSHDAVPKILAVVARLAGKGLLSDKQLRLIGVIAPGVRDWTVTLNPAAVDDPVRSTEQGFLLRQVFQELWFQSFGAQTAELMNNVLILISERGLTLKHIQSLLRDPRLLRSHVDHSINLEVREYFQQRYLPLSDRKRYQISEPVLNKVTLLFADPRISAMLGQAKSDIDFEEAIRNGRTILVDLNKGQLQSNVSLLGSLLLFKFQQALFAQGSIPESRRRTYGLTIDEFASYCSRQVIEPLLNEGRKYGLALTLITQAIGSIDRDLIDSVRTNCMTRLAFRQSPEDARYATAGLSGEIRDLIARELVSLPIGTAFLFKGGDTPQRLAVENLDVPDEQTEAEKLIELEIRHNVGRPLAGPIPRPIVSSTVSKVPKPTVEESPSTKGVIAPPNTAGDLVEGDA